MAGTSTRTERLSLSWDRHRPAFPGSVTTVRALCVVTESRRAILAGCGPGVWVFDPSQSRPLLLAATPLPAGQAAGAAVSSEWMATWPTVSVPPRPLRLRLSLRARPATAGGLLLTLAARNAGVEPARIEALAPLHCAGGLAPETPLDGRSPMMGGAGLDGYSLWLHGRQMTSDALVHRVGDPDGHQTFSGRFVESDPADPDDAVWISHSMVVLGRRRPPTALLLGFVSLGHQFTEVRIDTTGGEEPILASLIARCSLDEYVLQPGASVVSETLMIALGDDPVALADAYARETARRMRARVPRQVPTGWCSWYYFYNRVNERDVISNLDALRRLPYRVDYAQIDDGFQAATGDWLTPNEKFPRGMKPVADEIAAAGFRPGLWLAPFTVNRASRLFAEHPEWLLRDERGEIITWDIWLGPCAGLDCTHPGAQQWLRHLVRTVVREWGYTFLKLDALFTACYPGARHHAPTTTTTANLRRGLAIIREEAGDDTFILGCSCPFGPAIGLVDAMRVGPDVEARWFNDDQPTQPSAKNALRLSLQRNWMHRRFWLNDPDCLTVRDDSSPVVPGSLTLDEARFLATGIALSGGLTVFSDDLATLSPERQAIALRVLPPAGRAAVPVDLLDRETPSVWKLPLGRARLAVAVLNWDDTPHDFTVSWDRLGLDGPHYAREQWSGAGLGRLDGELRLPAVPPHACRVVLLDPHRTPRATRRLFPVHA